MVLYCIHACVTTLTGAVDAVLFGYTHFGMLFLGLRQFSCWFCCSHWAPLLNSEWSGDPSSTPVIPDGYINVDELETDDKLEPEDEMEITSFRIDYEQRYRREKYQDGKVSTSPNPFQPQDTNQ